MSLQFLLCYTEANRVRFPFRERIPIATFAAFLFVAQLPLQYC
jgi:hypothetical protein